MPTLMRCRKIYRGIANLVVGFALGSTHTSVLTGALVIGVVSVGLSLGGLELGARIGNRAGERGSP